MKLGLALPLGGVFLKGDNMIYWNLITAYELGIISFADLVREMKNLE